MSGGRTIGPFVAVFRRAVNGRASPRGEPHYRGLCPCVWIQDRGLSLWKVKVGRSHASANEMSDSRDARARPSFVTTQVFSHTVPYTYV